uniref:DUF8040 domain-containing protein n=1 Tax=Oryza brachyantha TaxID=4533 RepID=J3KZV7_ORYBR
MGKKPMAGDIKDEDLLPRNVAVHPYFSQWQGNGKRAVPSQPSMRGVDREEQLAMFMYMISHNARNQELQNAFQHSGETISRKINEVFLIIPTLAEDLQNLQIQQILI